MTFESADRLESVLRASKRKSGAFYAEFGS
jgi:hypothetical protein